MTDDIKVGDRFLVPVEVIGHEPVVGEPSVSVRYGIGNRVIGWFHTDHLLACTRLPPEIGVEDEVRTTFTPAIVKAIDGDIAWLRSTVGDRSYFSAGLSDLTLIKKAET